MNARYMITNPAREEAIWTDKEAHAFFHAKQMAKFYGWPSIILDRQQGEYFQLSLRGKDKRPLLRKLLYQGEVE
jgi:hypothetical protein